MKTIFVDGSGRGKFESGYGYFIKETGESKFVTEPGLTNNEAEYKAILRALVDWQDLEEKITIKSDSKNTVNQINHEYAINKDSLRKLAQQIWAMIGQMEAKKITFEWIPRKENLAGKMLGS